MNLQLIISKSFSFEIGKKNNSTSYLSKGDMIGTLKELGFVKHEYFNRQSFRVESSNMWHKVNEQETEGLFIFVSHDNTWHCTELANGKYRVN